MKDDKTFIIELNTTKLSIVYFQFILLFLSLFCTVFQLFFLQQQPRKPREKNYKTNKMINRLHEIFHFPSSPPSIFLNGAYFVYVCVCIIYSHRFVFCHWYTMGWRVERENNRKRARSNDHKVSHWQSGLRNEWDHFQ